MTTWRKGDLWFCKVFRDGVYHTGGQGFATKDEALACELQIKAKLRSGEPTSLGPRTFKDCWADYLLRSQAHDSKGWFHSKELLGKFFSHWFNQSVNSIKPSEIETFLIQRKNDVSSTTSNRAFEVLKAFFTYCQNNEWVLKNPLKQGLKKFHVDKKEKIIPSDVMVARLLSANEGKDQLLVALLAMTGGRISELTSLKWSDIDMVKKTLNLTTRKTKDGSSKTRSIDICPELLEMLSKMNVGYEYVLVRDRQGKKYQDIRRRLTRCFQAAGLPEPKGFHQFRHYFASTLLNAGTPVQVVRDMLGHSSIEILNVYSHSKPEGKATAVAAISKAIAAGAAQGIAVDNLSVDSSREPDPGKAV